MFTVEESLITEYEKVLTGEIKALTSSFFDNCTPIQKEKYAIIIIKYAFKNLLQLSPEQALKAVSKELLDKLKLTPFLHYIRYPYNLNDSFWDYIVFLCYPNTFLDKKEKLILYVYKKALSKEIRLPIDFFAGEYGKETTSTAFRYQLDFINETVDELYKIFSVDAEAKRYLTPFKLSGAIGTCFRNGIEMLHYSLPPYMKSNLWYNYYNFKKEYTDKRRELKKNRRGTREKKN